MMFFSLEECQMHSGDSYSRKRSEVFWLTIILTLNVIDPGSSLLKSFYNETDFKLEEVRVCVSHLKIILSRLHGPPAESLMALDIFYSNYLHILTFIATLQ